MRDEVRRLTGIWIKVKYTEWTSQRWASYLGHARSEKPDGRTFEATSPETFLRELFLAPIKMPYNFVPPGCESEVLGAGITDDAAEEAFNRAADGWKVPDQNINPTGHDATSSGPLHINEHSSIGNKNNNSSSLIDGNKEATNMNEHEGPKKRKRRRNGKGKKKGHFQRQYIKPGPPPPRAPNPLRMAVLQNQLNKLKVDEDVSEEKDVGVSSRWDITYEEWAALRSGANDNGHTGNIDTAVSSCWDITYEEWVALRSGTNGNEHPGDNNATAAAAYISKGAPLSTQQEGSSIVTDDNDDEDDDDESSEPRMITTREWDTGKPRRRIDQKKKVNSHAAGSIKDSIRTKKKEKEKKKKMTPPEPKKNNRRNKLNVREEFRQKLDVSGNSWAARLQAIVQRGNYDEAGEEGGYPRLARYFLVAVNFAIQERARVAAAQKELDMGPLMRRCSNLSLLDGRSDNDKAKAVVPQDQLLGAAVIKKCGSLSIESRTATAAASRFSRRSRTPRELNNKTCAALSLDKSALSLDKPSS
ncbi:unnamed protein product [Tilletia controversa]|uniref:Uncharacterized protein n=3 Tax=Tilletia TaxID=13289 RepID=A0A8X7N1E7_9BASI|nr:hypothetical protein CF336_g670 [Tilletia laevis]KAE8206028.1 hypothetical protein CF328_g158 [Tilletia controversa]KAE8265626.1 hypothetical protein A4X03_0g150 [Tilletia caries]KAE8208422.1 hypothetical protein CF335_g429 [Tilletia laevis]KAE8255427.1 hypothetical protein A4X06_0g427 [Tilletia controversa]